MITQFKVAALCVAIALVLVIPVAAQQSNTNAATAGVFSSDVDDSMDVHWYTGVEFEKWAGFIGYGSGPISLGYATRFGNIYLGTWYTGNIATSSGVTTETVTNTYDLSTQLQTTRVTSTQYQSFETNSNNEIAALIGVSGMGIKVGFSESITTRKNPNTTVTVTEQLDGDNVTYVNEIDEYNYFDGTLTPSLEWGMKLPVGEGGLEIRPKVGALFAISQNKYLLNTKANYITPGAEPTINGQGHNNSSLSPYIYLDVGIGLPAPEKTSKSVNVGYGLGLDIYSNAYDVFGFSGTAKGTVEWYNASSSVTNSLESKVSTKNATLEIDEQTYFDHNISVGYYYDKEIFENFTFGLYTAIPIRIRVRSSDSYTQTLSNTRTEFSDANFGYNTTSTSETTSPNNVTNTTIFSVTPYANFGAKYALFPGRFQINAGISLSPCSFTNTVTKNSKATAEDITKTKIVDDNGNVISETETVNPNTTDTTVDSVRVANNWGYLGAGLSGGFVFNFNDNASLDLAASSITTFTLNLTTVNVLFTIKF